jgi:hypothetical protein
MVPLPTFGAKVVHKALDCFVHDEVPPGLGPLYDTLELNFLRYYDKDKQPIWFLNDQNRIRVPLVDFKPEELEQAALKLLILQSEALAPVQQEELYNIFGAQDLNYQFLDLGPTVLALPEQGYSGIMPSQGKLCNFLLTSPFVFRVVPSKAMASLYEKFNFQI